MPNGDVNDVKEFMSILSNVQVSVAEVNGKMDRVMDTTDDTKKVVEQLRIDHDKTKETANKTLESTKSAHRRIDKIDKIIFWLSTTVIGAVILAVLTLVIKGVE